MGRIRDSCCGFPTDMQGRAVYPPLLLSCIFGSAFRLSGMPRFAAIHRRSASVDVHSEGFCPSTLPFTRRAFALRPPFL